MSSAPYHRAWSEQLRNQPPETALNSPLLALHTSSDVDPVLPEQITDAREVLKRRDAALAQGAAPDSTQWQQIRQVQRRVVERFLAGRRAHFGPEQCAPLPGSEDLAREGRDVFLVVKYMDEEPHLAATLHSLLSQRGVDPGRLVIVAVDNNSSDGSDRIAQEIAESHGTPVRIVCLRQTTPGAGNAARYGVDRCLATIHAMCRHDGDWSRLQSAVVAVSDGDTVYHPMLVRETLAMLEESPAVDAVMPFLTYKFTAALRLFADYRPAKVQAPVRPPEDAAGTAVPVDLADLTAFDALPRRRRLRSGPDMMELGLADGGTVDVPLTHADGPDRRYGVLRDSAGRIGYLYDDRTLVLAQAPVSGVDAALVQLENGRVRPDEKWRWHALIGHDLFLQWMFAGMGIPEEMIFPDTSDALKTVRAWAFAIGGQHQLRRTGLRIATGSDYQSGRVLQATGCTVRLGPAHAPAETEIDRLSKMARNLVRNQSVFYGETRSTALERATGLYVHMTRIQGDIESELRGYDDRTFEQTVFPERVLFPLRWVFQNAVRFYAHDDEQARGTVRERVLRVIFPPGTAAEIERTWFGPDTVERVRKAHSDERLDVAESVAEGIIGENHAAIMAFYSRTLRDFFGRQQVPAETYEWLLDGMETSRNAITERPPAVDPAAVWAGGEFDIDIARGQATRMRTEQGD